MKKQIKGVSKKSKKIAKPTKKNFTKEQLTLATNILYSSRRVYKMLRNQKVLDLPHIRTVYRHLERFKCWPGINNEMLHLLKLFLSSLDPEDRVCGVLADEIKLAEAITYAHTSLTKILLNCSLLRFEASADQTTIPGLLTSAPDSEH